MKIVESQFGYVVLLTPAEHGTAAIAEKIEKLKTTGKVAIIVSGREDVMDVICRMLKTGS